MRFYTEQHQHYCGIDLHARTHRLPFPSVRAEDRSMVTYGENFVSRGSPDTVEVYGRLQNGGPTEHVVEVTPLPSSERGGPLRPVELKVLPS